MNSSPRRHFWRLFILGAVLFSALACGDSSCGCSCVEPLDQPMAESEKVYDAIQARMTPQAFSFVEGNLSQIIANFLADGLAFDVPYIRQEFDLWLFTIVIDICENGCTLNAEILDATLSRVEPNVLHLDAMLNLTGTVYMTNDVDCDIPINVQNKPVTADILLLIDPVDHLLTIEVTGLDLTIEEDDFDLDCSGLLGWIIEALKGTITDLINDEIAGQLDTALDDMLASTTCLACDFYLGGCPAGSNCGGDYCEDGTGACVVNPLGIVGRVDLGSALADFAPGLQAYMDLFLAAGQMDDPTVDPMVVADGVEVRVIGGAEAERNQCVPDPDPADIPPVAAPPRLPFATDNTIPGTADTYMAGIGVSDAFLDQFMYKAWLSGLLCLSLDTDATGGILSSGTLAALLASLNALTGGANTPVRIDLMPQRVPSIEVGAGTFTVDGEGNRIMDEPLINVFLPETAMDFYVLVDGRWIRVVTLTQDLTLFLGLDFLPDNRVLPILDENSVVIENVVASNYELLAEDPAALENILPTLLGLALPLLTDALGVIDLPPVEGFAFEVSAVQGDLARQGTDYFEYLGLYANLALATMPVPPPRETRALVAQVHTPVRSLMSIYAPGGPSLPEVLIEVGADAGSAVEYQVRVDGRGWSPFRSGPRLWVRSPLLGLEGEHRIEVRARSVGDYHTLDPRPVVLSVQVEPEEDGLSYDPPPTYKGLEAFGQVPQGQALTPGISDEEDPGRVGCATTGGSRLFLLLLVGLGWWSRRRS